MPNQTIGLEGKFNLGNFNASVKKYVAGLTEIRNETLKTVSVMNGFGNAVNRNFGNSTASLQKFGSAAQGSFGGTAKQLHYLDQALRRGNASIAAAQGGLHGLSVAGIAVGTAIGQVAVRAIERLTASMSRLVSQGLELVVFFERLELSINFFAARSAQSADGAISFADALRQTSEQAEGLLIWVRQLAITSPLTTQQVGQIFRVSQAYGLLAEEAQVLLPLLLDLGAATGLDPQTLENAARALGQIRSRGKLTGEEIRQLGNAGIPIRDILVKELGVTNQEFDNILESGQLLSDLVIPAIVDSLRDFEGAAEKVAFETIGGLLSQLEEIKQIGLADFFKGVLAPIRPILEELVDFADNPQFVAGLRVIGEEIGGVIATAIQRLRDLIVGFIGAWKALSPEVQKSIIVFIAAGAAITVTAGALGILFFAIQALINPFTLLVGVLAASVTAWVRWGEDVVGIVQGAVRAVLRAIEGLAGFFDDLITTLIGGEFSTIEQYGEGAGDAWATGFASGAVGGASRAINTLSSYLVDQLRPGSYPKALQALQGSGEGAIQPYFEEMETGIQNSGLGKFLSENVSGIFDDVEKIASGSGEKAAYAYYGAWELPSITELTDYVKPPVEALGAEGGPVVEAANTAGIIAGEEWVNGFISQIPVPFAVASQEINEILGQIGGGRQLSRSGAETFGRFLDGFKDADFGILGDIAGEVSAYLGSLADLGEIPDIEVPRALFDVREAVAGAIKEFRDLGTISESSFRKVRSAAGPVGEQVERILRSYQDYAKETIALANAQQELNDITKQYDDLLDPLYAKLRKVSDERQTAEDVRELAQLQRIVNSKIVTDERKRIAAAQIQEILTRQQIRNLESQRDEEQGIAQEKVDGAKTAQDAAKESLQLLQEQVAAQNDQLALVADEAKQIQRLQDQLAKLQDKQLSALDRQLKFLGLVQQEITDSRNAAKAKFTLESDTSSEYEKQKATLDLQQIALQRIAREASAIELGFSPSELQQYRDLLFSLEDLGIKTGDGDAGGLGDSFAIDPSQLPDTEALREEFNKTLEDVRSKINEIKAEFLAFLTEVNAQLPEFLRFFGEEGEEPPIIGTLKRMTVAVVILGVALKAIDLAAKFAAISTAIAGVTAAASGGAAAGGVAAGIGLVAAFGQIAIAAIAAYAAITVLKAGLKAFTENEAARYQQNLNEINETLGDFGPKLEAATTALIEDIQPRTQAAADSLKEAITFAATDAINQGLTGGEIVETIRNNLEEQIRIGAVADTQENRASLEKFYKDLGSVAEEVSTQNVFVPKSIGLGDLEIASQEIETSLNQQLDQVFSGLTSDDPRLESILRNRFVGSVQNALELGVSPEEIGDQRIGIWQTSIFRGLLEDSPELNASITEYARTLNQARIDALTAEENKPAPPKPSIDDIFDTSEAATAGVQAELASFYGSLTGTPEQVESLASSLNQLVEDAATQGWSDQELWNSLGFLIDAGVASGIIANDTETKTAVDEYVNAIYEEFATATESQSPSERSKREVGVPIAEGIALGIGSVDQTTAVKVAVEQILAAFDDLRNRGAEKFDTLRNTLTAKQRTLRQSLVLATQETNRAILKEYEALTEETNSAFVALFEDILTGWIELSDSAVVEVNNMVVEVVSSFNSLSSKILDGPSGLRQLKADIVEVFKQMNEDVGVEASNVNDTIIGEFVTNEDSIINQLRTSLFGTSGDSTTSPVYAIGSSIMSGIALGITDNAVDVRDAILSSLGGAFISAGTYIQSGSPSLLAANDIGLPISQGVAAGILSGARDVSGSLYSVISGAMGSSVDALMGSYSSSATPASVSQVSRTTNYNLNVNSAVPSSGLISDFAILKSVAVAG